MPSAEGSPEHLTGCKSKVKSLSIPAGFSPSPWAQFVSMGAVCTRLRAALRAAPPCSPVGPIWQMLAFSKVTAQWAATLLWPLLSTLTC